MEGEGAINAGMVSGWLKGQVDCMAALERYEQLGELRGVKQMR